MNGRVDGALGVFWDIDLAGAWKRTRGGGRLFRSHRQRSVDIMDGELLG